MNDQLDIPVSFSVPEKEESIRLKKTYFSAFALSSGLLFIGASLTMQAWGSGLASLASPLSMLIMSIVLIPLLMGYLLGKTPANKWTDAAALALNASIVFAALLVVVRVALLTIVPYGSYVVGDGKTGFDLLPWSYLACSALFMISVALFLSTYTNEKSRLVPKKLFGSAMAWAAIVLVICANLAVYLHLI